MDSLTTAETDAQLFATLCEIDKYNYLFLFEQCKQFNVNARQLRYFEKDHIRNLIPQNQLGVLAEFEYLIKEWQIQKGFTKSNTLEQKQQQQMLDTADIKDPNLLLKEKSIMCSRETQTDNNRNQSVGINTEWSEFTVPSDVVGDEQQDIFTVLTFNDEESMRVDCQCPDSNSETTIKGGMGAGKDKYLLQKIIPSALARAKSNYRKKKLLTEADRRLVAGSIVNYFELCQVKLVPHVMENLADQITQHFPTESKKAWYDRHNSRGRGRLYMKFYNSHRSKNSSQNFQKTRKLPSHDATSNDSTYVILEQAASVGSNDTEDTNVSSVMDDIVVMDQNQGSKMVQSWLKSHKCEDFSEIVEMWQDTLHYRLMQLKDLNDIDDVKNFLENWPSYKLARGHELLNLDFEQHQKRAMGIFRTRWLVYQQSIVPLLEAEVKDINCLNILIQYKSQVETLNENSNSCVLLYLLHAITKPYRVFKTATGSVRYCISDSQHSVTRLIQHESEMDDYNDPYPCVFVVGDQLLDIRECYVAFLDIRYKLNFVDCLVACMQLYTLFKLEEPLPSLHFWQFVRGYLFDIHKAKERPYAIMENVIQYLETAGKRNID